MDAISDDYYNEMNLKFLINEYERAKIEKQNYMIFINKRKHQSDFLVKLQSLNKHVKRLKHKEKEIMI